MLARTQTRQLTHWPGWALVLSITLHLFTPAVAAAAPRRQTMNEQAPLYSWLRGGAAVVRARISALGIQPAASGQERAVLVLAIERVLAGSAPGSALHYEILRPQSELARKKFPDPIWGRVRLQQGAELLLVADPSAAAGAPLYAEALSPSDPVFLELEGILAEEQRSTPPAERLARYLRWLTSRSVPERLFAAEALAKDPFSDAELEERVAPAMAAVFTGERDLFVRVSLGEWMWKHLYPRIHGRGAAAVVDALLRSVSDPAEDVRRLALDALTEADPLKLAQLRIAAGPAALKQLQERLRQEQHAEVRARIQRIVQALHPAHFFH